MNTTKFIVKSNNLKPGMKFLVEDAYADESTGMKRKLEITLEEITRSEGTVRDEHGNVIGVLKSDNIWGTFSSKIYGKTKPRGTMRIPLRSGMVLERLMGG